MKKIGIIDIGTNTVRGVCYNIGEKNIPIDETVFESHILKYTKNSCLTEEGIQDLGNIINSEKEFFKNHQIDEIYAYATSAMRDIENFDEVKGKIFDECAVEIDLLSEKEEAQCDCIAIKNELSDKCAGIAVDLGGGSCQIGIFNENEVTYSASFPLGVKRLFNKYGKYQPQNKCAVVEYINELIKTVPDEMSDCLYVMGGTGKIIAGFLKREFFADFLDNEKSPFDDEKNFNSLRETNKNTLPYGVLVLSEIAKKFNAERIKIMSCSSRDGYIVKKII